VTRRSSIRHKYLELRAYVFARVANRMFGNKQKGEAKDAEFPKDEHHASKLTRG
jgi:hypothetical protein